MPVFVDQSLTATTVTNVTETIVLTTRAIPINAIGAGVLVQVTVAGTVGSTQTTWTVRVRQGTLVSGTVVGVPVAEVQGGGGSATMNASILDTSVGTSTTPAGTAQYVVTVQQSGGAGNGTMALATAAIEVAS